MRLEVFLAGNVLGYGVAVREFRVLSLLAVLFLLSVLLYHFKAGCVTNTASSPSRLQEEVALVLYARRSLRHLASSLPRFLFPAPRPPDQKVTLPSVAKRDRAVFAGV